MSESLTIEFFVPGIARPGGSKTATLIRRKGGEIVMKNGRALITMRDAGKHTAEWRRTVALMARRSYRGTPLQGPLCLTLTFVMPRPQSHFRANGTLKYDSPKWHTCKPDRTKLMRALEDALTGICWIDDTQVVTGMAEKIYGEKSGAHVRIEPVPLTKLTGEMQDDLFDCEPMPLTAAERKSVRKIIKTTEQYPESEGIVK